MNAKQVLAMFLAGAMVFGMTTTAFAEESTEAATEAAEAASEEAEAETGTDGRPTVGNGLIGFSTMTLGAEFFSDLDEKVHNRLEAAGYTVETVSCEMNTATQVADIENLINMGCEAIFYFAVDADSLMDVSKRGMEAGIKMYGIAFEGSDPDCYDAIINTDQRQSGVDAAQLMSDWVDETFPDAEDGSIEIAVIGNTSTSNATDRTEGMESIAELNSKVTVVETYDLSGATDSNIKAQEFAEMMQSQYPDLKGILSYGCDASLGANEVYMRDSELNKDEFAIIGVDSNSAVYEAVSQSRDNESLIRAHVSLGDDLSLDVWNCLTGESWQYMDENKNIFAPTSPITVDNVDEIIANSVG